MTVEELLNRVDDVAAAVERAAAAFERMALALETMAAVYRDDVYAADAADADLELDQP